jgi:hypothetical protein
MVLHLLHSINKFAYFCITEDECALTPDNLGKLNSG